MNLGHLAWLNGPLKQSRSSSSSMSCADMRKRYLNYDDAIDALNVSVCSFPYRPLLLTRCFHDIVENGFPKTANVVTQTR